MAISGDLAAASCLGMEAAQNAKEGIAPRVHTLRGRTQVFSPWSSSAKVRSLCTNVASTLELQAAHAASSPFLTAWCQQTLAEPGKRRIRG